MMAYGKSTQTLPGLSLLKSRRALACVIVIKKPDNMTEFLESRRTAYNILVRNRSIMKKKRAKDVTAKKDVVIAWNDHFAESLTSRIDLKRKVQFSDNDTGDVHEIACEPQYLPKSASKRSRAFTVPEAVHNNGK